MSIVINLVSKSRSWIMSDGRAVGAENSDIKSENIQKFTKLSDRLIVGYTGNYNIARYVIEELRKSEIRLSFPVESIVKQIDDKLNSLQFENGDHVQFVVTGLSSNGYFASATCGRPGKEIGYYYPDEKLRDVILYNRRSGNLDKYVERSRRNYVGDKAIMEAMKRLIEDVSKHDLSVNTVTYFDVLSL
jgi:hypothetical protein